MKKICISADWKFKNLTNGTQYEDIDLPHDYQIKQKRTPDGTEDNGFFPDTVGKYVKYLSLEKNRHYILDIDGAYMCAQVMLNEQYLGMHPYGYTPFLVDLTPHILENMTNKLVITTSPLKNSTRWYSGNGIYRDVFLWEGGEVRIEPWDLFISTVNANKDKATLRVKYTLNADEESDVDVAFEIISEGSSVKKKAVSTKAVKGKTNGTLLINLSSPLLWDIEAPNLYTLHTEIFRNGIRVDETDTVFGIRTVTADAKNGLLLNGRSIKLRGGCIHHDHGELGAAAYPVAEERKLRKLKEAGFNAIRCTHNPSSLALLEACDRLGIIAMDEAFDVWNIPKCQFDYHLFFSDWWARDISYMVLRDRNHPCVFSYSIGNEILEINGTSKASEWSKKLCDEVRKYDDTRFVTSALQKAFARKFSFDETDPDDYREFIKKRFEELKRPEITNTVTLPYEKPLDIVGVNYYADRYGVDHEMYPDRVLWGSETRAIRFYRSWKGVTENSFVLGDFTWTAYDNIGEAGAGRFFWGRDIDPSVNRIYLSGNSYPWRNCYQGDFDLCGFRRPQSYFRESIWRENTQPRIFVTHPEHYGEPFMGTEWHWYDVDECWTYDDIYEGRPIKAETYTSADRIEWFVNGKKVGESQPIEGIASIDTIYEKGSIRAVAYKNGEAYSEYTLSTVDKPSRIALFPEKEEIFADGRDLCYIPISLNDKNGCLVVNDDKEISCVVRGGKLLALFSGDPKTEDDVNSNSCHTFKGHALAIVSTKKSGTVYVTVFGNGLSSQTVTLRANDK